MYGPTVEQFDALEKRVRALEQKAGYSTPAAQQQQQRREPTRSAVLMDGYSFVSPNAKDHMDSFVSQFARNLPKFHDNPRAGRVLLVGVFSPGARPDVNEYVLEAGRDGKNRGQYVILVIIGTGSEVVSPPKARYDEFDAVHSINTGDDFVKISTERSGVRLNDLIKDIRAHATTAQLRAQVCQTCSINKPLSYCSGCNTTAYCSVECQLEDWKGHKTKCGGRF
jgi:hypothetical protein